MQYAHWLMYNANNNRDDEVQSTDLCQTMFSIRIVALPVINRLSGFNCVATTRMNWSRWIPSRTLGPLIAEDGECTTEFRSRLNRGQVIGASLQKI